jgi:hypothetical protein
MVHQLQNTQEESKYIIKNLDYDSIIELVVHNMSFGSKPILIEGLKSGNNLPVSVGVRSVDRFNFSSIGIFLLTLFEGSSEDLVPIGFFSLNIKDTGMLWAYNNYELIEILEEEMKFQKDPYIAPILSSYGWNNCVALSLDIQGTYWSRRKEILDNLYLKLPLEESPERKAIDDMLHGKYRFRYEDQSMEIDRKHQLQTNEQRGLGLGYLILKLSILTLRKLGFKTMTLEACNSFSSKLIEILISEGELTCTGVTNSIHKDSFDYILDLGNSLS